MKNTDTTASSAAAAATIKLVYEVTAEGPIKVGGVLAFRTARLSLTKDQADAINTAFPDALKCIGI